MRVVSVAVCLAGCPGPSGGDGGALQVEAGIGVDHFVALTGQDVNIVYGPQGGTHVWAAVRVGHDAAPARAKVTLTLSLADTELSRSTVTVGLVDAGEFYEWYALQAIVPDPQAIDGKTVKLRIEVHDERGRFGVDERALVARLP